ncbi:zinc metalloproteinase nas-6-like isoform X2 [Anneissia japonica]|uniref:zinc metalloproteinase nas-6-like isoform X2 n=1 Tax=Anneissia japonica TaxID=1529436 RepID=UPI001425B8A4|nr:zinc metalloproteinase nas-6-like isoform X2 [Anneissia japonica]
MDIILKRLTSVYFLVIVYSCFLNIRTTCAPVKEDDRRPWEINTGLCPPALADLCNSGDGDSQNSFSSPFFEGDIVLDLDSQFWLAKQNLEDSSKRKTRAIRKPKSKLWPGGIIPYELDTTFDKKTVDTIRGAMRQWERHTCIDFRKKKKADKDYIQFKFQPGCWSYIGRQGGRQLVSLGPGCAIPGTVLHELGHAIGFWHEQGRRDRDDYITIVDKNVAPGLEKNFGKIDKANVTSMGFMYDYQSVMHYGALYFTKNGKPTIKVKKQYRDYGFEIGQRDRVSDLDIAQIRAMYKCNKLPVKEKCFQSKAGDGREYRGKLDYTRKGITCQKWSSNWPHKHNYYSDDKKVQEKKGFGNHNYCRNPGGRRERLWCFTTLKNKVWDYCDIKICEKN